MARQTLCVAMGLIGAILAIGLSFFGHMDARDRVRVEAATIPSLTPKPAPLRGRIWKVDGEGFHITARGPDGQRIVVPVWETNYEQTPDIGDALVSIPNPDTHGHDPLWRLQPKKLRCR